MNSEDREDFEDADHKVDACDRLIANIKRKSSGWRIFLRLCYLPSLYHWERRLARELEEAAFYATRMVARRSR